MKDIEKMVDKYFCINDRYYARYFEGESKSRFREDDHEYVYWREYPRVGGGRTKSGSGKEYSVLLGDAVTDNSYRFAKSHMFKTIRRHEWMRGLVKTVFAEDFIGIEGNFIELLDKT